jgi:hypothetical protein
MANLQLETRLRELAKATREEIAQNRGWSKGTENPALLEEAAETIVSLHQQLAEHEATKRRREEPWKLPAPSCIRCSEPMAWQPNVALESETGPVVTMPHALVCPCGYKTIAGSQMGEFQSRALKAELEAAEARIATLEQQLAAKDQEAGR